MNLIPKSAAPTGWGFVPVLAAGLMVSAGVLAQGERTPNGGAPQASSVEAAKVEEAKIEEAGLTLFDELGPLTELGVGRSLSVAGGGFGDAADLTVVLADALGVPVAEAEVRTDPAGGFAVEPLWPMTGIRGCDCDLPPAAWAFRTYEGALQALAGAVLTLTVEESTSGRVITALDVPVAAPKGIVGFVSDAAGCPRFRFTDDEDVYFRAVNTSLDDRFDVTLTTVRTAPFEIREEQPEGDVFAGQGASTLVRVWTGEESHLGGFVLQANTSGWPNNVQIFKEDGINSGVVEEDPACLVPPP
ncbi:MAG: hypothetical protein AAGF23_18025 [Acidobacteriota bacterium]